MPLPKDLFAADQSGAAFLEQIKPIARNFLAWLQEESSEEEHPDMAGDMARDLTAADEQPALLRTRTTTVHDFQQAQQPAQQPVTTDPPVSQAQRGAMHAAAQGNSTIGIPQGVGQEFAESDPGGQLPNKKTNDADPALAQRFKFDGNQLTDTQTGQSYSTEDVMRILFSDEAAPTPSPATQSPTDAAPVQSPVDVDRPRTTTPQPNVPTGKWAMPKFTVKPQEAQAGRDTSVVVKGVEGAGAAAGHLGEGIKKATALYGGTPRDSAWSSPQFPQPATKGGEGGAALGRLLKYKAGDTARDNTNSPSSQADAGTRIRAGGSSGDLAMKGAKDYGTSEGARKRAQGGGGKAPTSAAPTSGQHFYERRDAGGKVVERVGPFEKDSPEHRKAMQHQMQIADLHNRSRRSNDPSRQLVHPVEK